MSQVNIANARDILADNVIKLRKIHNIGKEELSLLLGFDNSYISKLEKSKINITIDKIEKLANYFNISVCDILRQK
ncbi:helix-turn-helix transcriptional regulator [bacterium]|nr:helix-turn-helix transcriptional regulator [bacterium]